MTCRQVHEYIWERAKRLFKQDQLEDQTAGGAEAAEERCTEVEGATVRGDHPVHRGVEGRDAQAGKGPDEERIAEVRGGVEPSASRGQYPNAVWGAHRPQR